MKPKKATAYRKQIKQCCIDAGTYRPFFDSIIDTLSDILEKRDLAEKQFAEEFDSQPVITYTNKAGASNPSKNPALVVINDLNTTALAYWRDLGLTPAGLKKIDEAAMKKKKRSQLADALRDLG